MTEVQKCVGFIAWMISHIKEHPHICETFVIECNKDHDGNEFSPFIYFSLSFCNGDQGNIYIQDIIRVIEDRFSVQADSNIGAWINNNRSSTFGNYGWMLHFRLKGEV